MYQCGAVPDVDAHVTRVDDGVAAIGHDCCERLTCRLQVFHVKTVQPKEKTNNKNQINFNTRVVMAISPAKSHQLLYESMPVE